MDPVDRLRGAVELTRPTNAVAAGALTFVGAFIGGEPASLPALTAVLATILATGAGMAINDYFDREVDAINRPDRPLPRGAVTPRWAAGEATLLFAIAVLLALTLPPIAIAIALINLVALASYTSLFKGLPGLGNGVVAFLGGSTFLFGGAAVGGMRETVILFLLAAFATLGREIIKDVEDVSGDRAEGLNTLPIAIGERPALWVAAVCLAVATIASPIPYVVGLFGLAYLVVVLPAILVMGGGIVVSFDDPATGQRYVKWGMYVAILAFVLGRLSAMSIGI